MLLTLVIALARHPLDIVILLLNLILPVSILYFIFWRWARLDAQFDLVIKYFAVGFFWTPLAAFLIEMVLTAFFMVILGAIF